MFTFFKNVSFVSIATLFTFSGKWIKEFKEYRLKSTKEQLDAIIDLYSDENKKNNSFLVEQVFSYKFGSYIPYRVILLLLKFENPTSAIKDYIIGKDHINLDINQKYFCFHGRIRDSL